MSGNQLSRRGVMRGAVLLGVGVTAGGMELLSSSAAHADVPSPTIHGTDVWGARPPSSSVTIHDYRPDKIIVHHTATANSTDYSLAHAYALSRSIQNWHMDHNGWIDSGQNFTISRGGHITEGRHRSLETLRDGSRFVHGAHAGPANGSSIGIENEGTYSYVSPTSALYNALVDHCAYICDQYAIPASRIYGHRDFMSTACPGEVLYGMLPQLRADVAAKLGGGDDGHTTIVDNTSSRFRASSNWGLSSWSSLKHGDNYRYANPVAASDAAYFTVDIPEPGNHRIDVWYASNSGYNSATPHVVFTADGTQVVRVDQRIGGGTWRSLGTFNLAAGDRDVLAVSRWTSASGYVIADAVRVTKV